MKTLKSNKEIADGTIYDSPLTTSWRAPTWILEKGKDYWNKVRSKMKIIGMGKIRIPLYFPYDVTIVIWNPKRNISNKVGCVFLYYL